MSSLSVSLQLQFVTSLCLQDEIICEMDASHQTLDRKYGDMQGFTTPINGQRTIGIAFQTAASLYCDSSLNLNLHLY